MFFLFLFLLFSSLSSKVNTTVVHLFTAFTTYLLFDDKDDFVCSKKADCSSADLPDPTLSDYLQIQSRGD